MKPVVPSSLTPSSGLSRFNSSVATTGSTLDQKVTAGLQQNFPDCKRANSPVSRDNCNPGYKLCTWLVITYSSTLSCKVKTDDLLVVIYKQAQDCTAVVHTIDVVTYYIVYNGQYFVGGEVRESCKHTRHFQVYMP